MRLHKIFPFFPSPDENEMAARRAYVTLVATARQPFLYEKAGIADSLDGRFDAIVLHLFLLLERLKTIPDTARFQRALQEAFFADMDRSLREMGVSDTGGGKRVKQMVEAFYGRLQSYEQTIDSEHFAETLTRNMYRGAAADRSAISVLVDYITRQRESLQATKFESILAGKFF